MNLTVAVFSLLLSGVLLVACQRNRPSLWLALCAIWYISFLLCSLYFIADYFSGSGINEAVLFHLQLLGDGGVLRQFWPWVVFAVVVVIVPPSVFYRLWARVNCEHKFQVSIRLTCVSVLLALVVQPCWVDVKRLAEVRISLRGLAQFTELFITPTNVVTPSHRPNLVYIYLESVDQWFFDESRFPGLLPNLQVLRTNSVELTAVHHLDKTAWTIAGISASQCGVPILKRVRELGQGRPFLCMGDLLKSAGYRQHFIGGADHAFAGKGNFFSSHGYDEVVGKHEIMQLEPALPKSQWGVYDDVMLDIAWRELQALKTQKPFVLSLLTLDTHPPHGHLTPACNQLRYGDGENRMLNAMRCTDMLVGKLVSRVMNDKDLTDTIIVIASDHPLVHKAGGFDVLESEKFNTFYILNSGIAPRKLSRRVTLLDIAPTLLTMMGFDVPAIGFGRNAFSSELNMMDVYGVVELNRLLNVWSVVMEQESTPITKD